MSWAIPYVDKLRKGETVQFRPRGDSMSGKIESGQLVTVVPAGPYGYQVGDIVLSKVRGRYYLHLVKAFRGGELGDEVQIANNKGLVNGWTKRSNIFGKVVKVEP